MYLFLTVIVGFRKKTGALVQQQQQQKSPRTRTLRMADPQRNEELEIKVRSALEGPDKDLGRLCKSLGEAFCLEPARNNADSGGGADGNDASQEEREHDEAVLHAVSAAARVREIRDCRRFFFAAVHRLAVFVARGFRA